MLTSFINTGALLQSHYNHYHHCDRLVLQTLVTDHCVHLKDQTVVVVVVTITKCTVHDSATTDC